MSTIYPVRVPCYGCGQGYEANIADSLNVERLPAVRDWVLDRTVHVSNCPECGRANQHEKDLFYADFGRGLFVQMYPEAQRTRFPALEEHVRREHVRAFGEQAPRIAQMLGKNAPPRIVFGYEELREKVLCADHTIDDRHLEVLKINVVSEMMPLVYDGVVALMLDRVVADDDPHLVFRLVREPMGTLRLNVPEEDRPHELSFRLSAIEKLAAQHQRLQNQLPQLFEGVYVNMLRYRFDPKNRLDVPAASGRDEV